MVFLKTGSFPFHQASSDRAKRTWTISSAGIKSAFEPSAGEEEADPVEELFKIGNRQREGLEAARVVADVETVSLVVH